MKTISIICPKCNKEFIKSLSQYKSNLKRNRQSCCSRRCASIVDGKGSSTVICKCCNKEFLKRNSQIKKSTNHFCSRSCSSSYFNSISPKRIKQNKPLTPKIIKESIISSCTKNELFSSRKNWQSARSCIRKNAERVFNKSNKERKCVVCGYSNHIEIAHIKSVSSFSGESLISEINDITNLIPLCPNHHWEFDNGILTL